MDSKNIECIVVHGCPSDIERSMSPETRTYDKHWMPWLKNQVTLHGIKIKMPLMPEPWYPDYKKFKKEFEKYPVSENSVLVGHSCGCAFLVRWLGETKKKIHKLILVAPWKISSAKDKFREKFYVYPIDKTIKTRVNRIVMFTSNNEEEEGKQSLKIFHNALGGKIIDLKNKGHYTFNDMGTEAFPELLKEII